MMPVPGFIIKILNVFTNIFHDSPAWAEFTSACSGFLYCALAVGSVVVLGKPPESWPSMDLVTDLIDGRVWITFAFTVSVFQLLALFSMRRVLRSIGAFTMLIWQLMVILMAWPVVPWAPILAFPIALCFPNFFAIARHARDWNK